MVSCLQYVNDTLLVIPNDLRSLGSLRILLYCFELLSGLSINIRKSSLYPLGLPLIIPFRWQQTFYTAELIPFLSNTLASLSSPLLYLIRIGSPCWTK